MCRIVWFFVGLLLIGWPSCPSHADEAECTVERVGDQTIVRLGGEGRAPARAMGVELRAEIRRAVDWLIDDLAQKQCGISIEALRKMQAVQAPYLPERYRAEMRGLAEGAGIELARLELANAVPPRIAASAGAAFGPKVVGGKLLLATGIEPGAGAPPVVLIVHRPAKGQKYASVTWPGYVGCLAGLNDRAIAASILSAPLPSDSAAGIGAAVLAREALRQGKALADTVSVFRDARRAGGAICLVADGKMPDARVLEMSKDGFAAFGADDSADNKVPHAALAGALRRSNHFVNGELARQQRPQYDPRASTGFSGIESWHRFERMTGLVAAGKERITLAETIQRLRGIVSENAPAAALAVLDPIDQEIWLAVAGSGTGPDASVRGRAFQCYNLGRLLSGRAASDGLRTDTLEKPLDPAAERRAVAQVKPPARVGEEALPEMYRIDSEPFAAEIEPDQVVQGIVRKRVRIPSPFQSPFPENNVIHGEYFRPFGQGPFTCVIVLHIAGGDFELSRFMANAVAQGGIAALFVKMPYYGERRPPGKEVKMLSADVGIASGAMQQTILDFRRVCDWIQSDPELDGDRIGILGVSLGSITGALATAIEPRISHACLIMGGAHLHEIIWGSMEPEARAYRKLWTESGGTKESLADILRPYDATTYADRLKERVVFMICASEDESVPKVASLALWEAAGKQEILWYPCGHYTMVRYLMPALQHTVKFFRDWPERKTSSAAGG